MTDTIISLVPDYGLALIFIIVMLACLAIPLPSSVLVLASGAFAASGDLVLWQVLVVAFCAFVIGDQTAFHLASHISRRLQMAASRSERLTDALASGQALLDRRGRIAVLLSHTVLSPTCPYVSYLCGVGNMDWRDFSVMATLGAAIWAVAYVMLGFVFANQLTQVATILSNFFGLAIMLALLAYSVVWLRRRWLKHHRLQGHDTEQAGAAHN
ncbi:DedA family protein [Pontivivens insulae]|uniref:VTT domain-containing protein n=1 Tax=Pontivivens insulae TaxID=1639689 RepID=A0A2R8AED7_9RHOB|nr:DedA family protein [Pontivivens insulae]RED11864.1 membrane protein DedA with SNARE-associated domain [Pontivivens insulae]SPF30621.1 hypothetical protein POI8812_02961 [Pontivivens insulae]